MHFFKSVVSHIHISTQGDKRTCFDGCFVLCNNTIPFRVQSLTLDRKGIRPVKRPASITYEVSLWRHSRTWSNSREEVQLNESKVCVCLLLGMLIPVKSYSQVSIGQSWDSFGPSTCPLWCARKASLAVGKSCCHRWFVVAPPIQYVDSRTVECPQVLMEVIPLVVEDTLLQKCWSSALCLVGLQVASSLCRRHCQLRANRVNKLASRIKDNWQTMMSKHCTGPCTPWLQPT